jgi:uncharacterized membrane protein YhiD involved in acid resistance
MTDFFALQTSYVNPNIISILFTILLSFLLSTIVGVTYIKTFMGLSYSRNYVQAVILSSIVASTVMHAIGDSLARGLGMIGALAIIRFRTNFKDAKDILFMFAALAAGIGCGVGAFSTAIVGTACFSLTSFLLHHIPLGQGSYFDGMLRFNMENTDAAKNELEKILREHCKKFALITLRDIMQGQRLDYAYHVKLKNDESRNLLIKDLSQEVLSAKGVSLLLQESTVEL